MWMGDQASGKPGAGSEFVQGSVLAGSAFPRGRMLPASHLGPALLSSKWGAHPEASLKTEPRSLSWCRGSGCPAQKELSASGLGVTSPQGQGTECHSLCSYSESWWSIPALGISEEVVASSLAFVTPAILWLLKPQPWWW